MDRTVYDQETIFFLHTVAGVAVCEVSAKSFPSPDVMRYTQKKQVETLRVAQQAHCLPVMASHDFAFSDAVTREDYQLTLLRRSLLSL